MDNKMTIEIELPENLTSEILDETFRMCKLNLRTKRILAKILEKLREQEGKVTEL